MPQCPLRLLRIQAAHGGPDVHLPIAPLLQQFGHHGLEPIDRQAYLEFANRHLSRIGKEISPEAFCSLYEAYDGVTWYIQYVLNMLYSSHLAISTMMLYASPLAIFLFSLSFQ